MYKKRTFRIFFGHSILLSDRFRFGECFDKLRMSEDFFRLELIKISNAFTSFIGDLNDFLRRSSIIANENGRARLDGSHTKRIGFDSHDLPAR